MDYEAECERLSMIIMQQKEQTMNSIANTLQRKNTKKLGIKKKLKTLNE